MKVLTVNTLYFPNELGGAEVAMRLLAERLVRAGHEAVVVSLDPNGRSSSRTIAGVRAHYVPLANVYWHLGDRRPPRWLKPWWHLLDAYNPTMARRLGRILDAERPDIVHAQNLRGFSVSAWVAAARRRIPIVQCLQDYYLGCPRSSMFRGDRNCGRQCVECRLLSAPKRFLSGLPHTIISASDRTLRRLEATGLFRGVDRRVVIHNCYRDEVAPTPRPDLGPGAPIRFGFIGRLDPLKGVALLLQAAANLPRDRISVFIAGRGTVAYEAHLRETYAAANVRFLGFVESRTFFPEIDVLVVPSLWEDPCPLVVIEAMSHGVPVIGARGGGISEIVDHGRTGFLFPAGDAMALRAIMRRLLIEGVRALGLSINCRARAMELSPDAVFERYMAVWQRAAASRR